MHGLAIAFDFPGRFFDEESTITYDGRAFILANGSDRHSHSVRTTYKAESDFPIAFRSACHFLNELTWFYRIPVTHSLCIHGSGSPRCSDLGGMVRDITINVHDFRQQVQDPRAHLALGFFREGFSANSPFYRFVSYFKIIELAHPNGRDREAWMSGRIPTLTKSTGSLERLQHARVSDVGKWLYEEGRNALSHAGGLSRTVRDICDFDHWQDIVWASEIVEEMAELLVTNTFAVPRASAA